MLSVNMPKWDSHIFSPFGLCTDSGSIELLIFLRYATLQWSGRKGTITSLGMFFELH